MSLTFLYENLFGDAGKMEKSKCRSRVQMATILVSSELTKLSSLYFQQLFTGENNIVRLIEVTDAVSKCILSTDRERPKSRPE